MEERIARLEEESSAYQLIIARLIGSVWDEERRARERELCCDAIEASYHRKLTAGGHERVQAILQTIEELFRVGGADDQTIPSD